MRFRQAEAWSHLGCLDEDATGPREYGRYEAPSSLHLPDGDRVRRSNGLREAADHGISLRDVVIVWCRSPEVTHRTLQD